MPVALLAAWCRGAVQPRACPAEVLHHIFQQTIAIHLCSFHFLDCSYGLLGIWAVLYNAAVCCILQIGLLLRQGSVSGSWLHSDQLQVQWGSHQLMLKHRVCCAECVQGGTVGHRQRVREQRKGQTSGNTSLGFAEVNTVIATCKVTGTQLHRRSLRKLGTRKDICQIRSR